jgi:hypothetical protein
MFSFQKIYLRNDFFSCAPQEEEEEKKKLKIENDESCKSSF